MKYLGSVVSRSVLYDFYQIVDHNLYVTNKRLISYLGPSRLGCLVDYILTSAT